jgi:low affinity Fe/Cu permease
MAEQKQQSAFDRIGCMISSGVADIAATPAAQIAVIVVCAAWFAAGFADALLTAILSIMAITLTQMVLNQQKEREADAYRRDVAMHAKLDELIAVSKHARNDFVGVEEKEEEEIVQLKEEVKDAIEETPEPSDPAAKETAKKAVDAAAADLKAGAKKTTATNGRTRKAAGTKG